MTKSINLVVKELIERGYTYREIAEKLGELGI